TLDELIDEKQPTQTYAPFAPAAE
ncbi:MAG: hypothetical protein RL091_87, partial [Verrucomicrobiota bacterium]